MTLQSGMWSFCGPSIDEMKASLETLIDVVFEERYSDEWGGDYWHTPLGERPSVMIAPNAEDEDGILYVHGHPEVTAVVDAAGLSDEQATAIEALGGIPIETYGNLST